MSITSVIIYTAAFLIYYENFRILILNVNNFYNFYNKTILLKFIKRQFLFGC